MNVTALRFTVRSIINRYPKLYFSLLHVVRSPRRHLHVRRDTEVVIEGYPRSANTYAVCAFLFAQQRPVRIAHHLHAPVQVIQAVRWGIPTLILIRRPLDAIASRLIRNPALSAERAVKDYISFYQAVQALRHGLVLATFEAVTRDFGQVIEALNSKFGTQFAPFVQNEENVRLVLRMVDEMDKADQGRESITITTVARPTPEREQLKREKKKALLATGALLEKAEKIYEDLIATADV